MKTKTIKIDTKTIELAAAKNNQTPAEFVSEIRSISLGRKVCAHFKKFEGALSVFSCL